VLRQDDFAKSQLVLVGWKYGHKYGGYLASAIIMSCLANRQKLGWGSWLEVIDGIPARSATIEQPIGIPSIWEPEFVRLLHEVESVYDGSKDYSKTALYWFDSAEQVSNPWFQEKILGDPQSHPVIGNMNSLMFLR
jgi:hypothetical protein